MSVLPLIFAFFLTLGPALADGVSTPGVPHALNSEMAVKYAPGTGGGGPSPPSLTSAPVVTGTATIGSTLSTTNGVWTNSPTGYLYQWLRNGTAISGATGSTYLTVSADGGTSVGSQVTANNAGGSSTPANSNTLSIAAGCSGYAGPNDAVSGAVAFFGLRAVDCVHAAALTTKAINLRRASDNATCDFDLLANGNLGNSDAGCAQGAGLSPSAFATVDATASCTIATATATCNGGSSLPHINSIVTGAGVGNPCYASAGGVGTPASFTVALAGGNGVGTAPCGTVGSPVTFTFTYGLNAPTFYDQIGTGCAGPCNLTQATATLQPKLFPACTANNSPCLFFNTTTSQVMLAASGLSASTPNSTVPVVLERNGRFTSFGAAFGNNGGTIGVGFTNVANTAMLSSGGIGSAPMADSVFHATQYLVDAASAGLNIDNVFTASSRTGANWNASAISLGANGANNFQGYLSEAGIWPSLLTTPQLTAMCHNQFSYWGTVTSC
jgi:hypothetical protein